MANAWTPRSTSALEEEKQGVGQGSGHEFGSRSQETWVWGQAASPLIKQASLYKRIDLWCFKSFLRKKMRWWCFSGGCRENQVRDDNTYLALVSLRNYWSCLSKWNKRMIRIYTVACHDFHQQILCASTLHTLTRPLQLPPGGSSGLKVSLQANGL